MPLKNRTPEKRQVPNSLIFWLSGVKSAFDNFCDLIFVCWFFQNRDRKDGKEAKQQKAQQQSAVESDGKSDSSSEIDLNASPASNDGKAHVEFVEEEIIAPETNTVQFKVISVEWLKWLKIDNLHFWFEAIN